jgi:hypothetical protein
MRRSRVRYTNVTGSSACAATSADPNAALVVVNTNVMLYFSSEERARYARLLIKSIGSAGALLDCQRASGTAEFGRIWRADGVVDGWQRAARHEQTFSASAGRSGAGRTRAGSNGDASPDQAETRFCSTANGLSPSHACILLAISRAPVSVIFDRSFSTVVSPIQIAVIVRRSVAT